MNLRKKETNIYYLTAVGLVAALVFAGSSLSIPIPLAVGDDQARIHFGNIFCLFAGYILGPVGGGFAAGIGSAFYDLTNPVYISSMPFTFAFKFAMAFVCGKIAYRNGNEARKPQMNSIAAVAGIATYIILYLTRNVIKDTFFLNLERVMVLGNLTIRGTTSIVNGIIAVLIAVPLGLAIRKALEMSNLMDKIRYSGGK